MLNEEKIRYMTKAAAFENGKQKKDIWISGFFRNDYVGFFMLRSGIAYTVAFLILAGIYLVADLEHLMRIFSDVPKLESYIRWLLIIYAVGLVFYETVAYFYYSHRHQNAKNSVSDYKETLKQIQKIYERENESATENGAEQGEESYDDFRD